MGRAISSNHLDTSGNNYVLFSEDFGVDGAQPTWTSLNEGVDTAWVTLYGGYWPGFRCLRVDPFEPFDIQYGMVHARGDGESPTRSLWRRNANDGPGWTKILDREIARGLFGYGGAVAGYEDTEMLAEVFAVDPETTGRLYATVHWLNVSNYMAGGVVLRSEDYGDDWSVIAQAPFQPPDPEEGLPGWTIVRRANAIEAVTQDNFVVGCNYPVFAGAGAHWMSTGKRTTAYQSSIWFPWAKPNPNFVPVEGGTGQAQSRYMFFTSDRYGSMRLVKVDPYFIVPEGGCLPTEIRTLLTGGTVGIPRGPSSDFYWIDPTNPAHHRILLRARLFVTYDWWQTLLVETPAAFITEGTAQGNLVTSPLAPEGPLYFSHGRHIYYLHNEESSLPTNLTSGATGWQPNGLPSYYGLYVDTDEPPGRLMVHGVEVGEAGADDPEHRGHPMWSDRGAWDAMRYAPRHARDIKQGVYIHHVPAGTEAGQILVWDGTGWVPGAAGGGGSALEPLLDDEPAILYDDAAGIIYEG